MTYIPGVEVKTNKNTANGYASLNSNRELPHHIKKVASNNIRNSHDLEVVAQSGDFQLRKTINLTHGLIGQIRVFFDVRPQHSSDHAYVRIYKNNRQQQLGTEHVAGYPETYADPYHIYPPHITFSEDITESFVPGDTIELWVRAPGAFGGMSLKNFRLCYDDGATVVVDSINS